MVYSALFGVGKLLMHHWSLGIFLALVATICAWRMARELNHEQGAPQLPYNHSRLTVSKTPV
jgi:hypothetical protein